MPWIVIRHNAIHVKKCYGEAMCGHHVNRCNVFAVTVYLQHRIVYLLFGSVSELVIFWCIVCGCLAGWLSGWVAIGL